MSIEKLTSKETEADLEARLHSVLLKCFPWLDSSDIEHQTKFKFKFGRQVYNVDCKKDPQAIADIIVKHKGQSLAVFELKRPGNAITKDDEKQGLSYAKMLIPTPPLVIVSNGTDTRILDSTTGELWQASTYSEVELHRKIKLSCEIAANGFKGAIDSLSSANSTIYLPAIRASTKESLVDLVGGWDNIMQPFVSGFLIPRKATSKILKELSAPERSIILKGAMSSGKSSVLCELAERTISSNEYAVLYIEVEDSTSIFQTIANILNNGIGWSITSGDVRQVLRNVSNKASGPTLVLAVDNVNPLDADLRKELNELASKQFGAKLKLVLACDEHLAEKVKNTKNGRALTNIRKGVKEVVVKPLDDQEFAAARKVLTTFSIHFRQGCEKLSEYRQPWILRMFVSDVIAARAKESKFSAVVLPSVPGLQLIEIARRKFDDNEDVRFMFQSVAKAMVDDVGEEKDIALTFQSMFNFIIRRKYLDNYLEKDEIQQLIEQGWIKTHLNQSSEQLVTCNTPELLVSELARLLAAGMTQEKFKDGESAAHWLLARVSKLPFAEVIGSQVLFDMLNHIGELPGNVVESLMQMTPQSSDLVAGQKLVMDIKGIGLVNLEVVANNQVIVDNKGGRETITMEDGEDMFDCLQGDITAFLILSLFASRRLRVEIGDGERYIFEPSILKVVGSYKNILWKPGESLEKSGLNLHTLKDNVVTACHSNGIIEPVTESIFRLLLREGEASSQWIDEAIAEKNTPLLARVSLALTNLLDCDDEKLVEWAGQKKVKVNQELQCHYCQ